MADDRISRMISRFEFRHRLSDLMTVPASTSAAAHLPGLPRMLLQAQLLSMQQLESAQRDSAEEKLPFIEALIRSGVIGADALA